MCNTCILSEARCTRLTIVDRGERLSCREMRCFWLLRSRESWQVCLMVSTATTTVLIALIRGWVGLGRRKLLKAKQIAAWHVLWGKLVELDYGLLWLFKAKIRGIWWDWILAHMLHGVNLPAVTVMSLQFSSHSWRIDVEDACSRPDITHRESRRVVWLRLRWILIVQKLCVHR